MVAFASGIPTDTGPFLGHMSRFCECGNLLSRWEKHAGGNHPDGWGIAYRQEEEIRVVRSGKPAASDPLLSEVAVRTDRFIGHVRYASNPDTIHAGNSHPFIASGIALAHNGTFYGKLGEEADARKVADSLVFLELLADRWKDRTLQGLERVLRAALSDDALVGEYSAANLLIAAGDRLFAFRNFRRDPEYYTLYLGEREGHPVVASEPLDKVDGWRLLEDGELVDLDPAGARSTLVAAGDASRDRLAQ